VEVVSWIIDSKESPGLSDRALSVLNALLTCLPETGMTAGPNLTVLPSNARLILQVHGMAELMLRRHLHAPARAGLIISQ
jgi:replication initiation protein RepC